MFRSVLITALLLASLIFASGQSKTFTPVEGANLKAKIDNAVLQGRSNALSGRFWVGYQFEVRPGVATDFEVVDGAGGVYISMDGSSMMFDPRYETRELGLFFLFDVPREQFTRAEVYNLKRNREFSGYPVFWAGHVGNEESLNYLKSMIDSTAPEVSRLADRAAYAIALHDDARVEGILTELIRRPAAESIRNRAIYWLGYTPESQAKNTLLTEIVRNQRESGDARDRAMAALGLSRAATTLPVLENLYETMTSREMKRSALNGIARNDNHDAAGNFLIQVLQNQTDIELQKTAISGLGRIAGDRTLATLTATLDSSPQLELQKQAVRAIGRRPKDEAIPILIRTARNHPKVEVKKIAVQMLGQTRDDRATAFLNELLAK